MSVAERAEYASTERRGRAVRPDVLQAALLDEIAERLLRIQEYHEEKRAEGVVEPIEPVSVTDEPRIVRAPFKPWFSVTIINEGPNDVWAIVNTEKSVEPHKVTVDETYKVDMGRGIIKDVLLKCDPGERATVRVVGSR